MSYREYDATNTTTATTAMMTTTKEQPDRGVVVAAMVSTATSRHIHSEGLQLRQP
jgi:phosphoserine aminotransferase